MSIIAMIDNLKGQITDLEERLAAGSYIIAELRGDNRELRAENARLVAESMDEKKAEEILNEHDGDSVCMADGSLYSIGWYLNWDVKDKDACLDGRFTPDELEAIAWWMRNKFKA